MADKFERLYLNAKKAEAAKRKKAAPKTKKRKAAKPSKGGKTTKRKAPKRNQKVKVLAESLAMLLDGQLRHGAGSPGVTAVAHALGLNGHPIRHGAGSTRYDAESRVHLLSKKRKTTKRKGKKATAKTPKSNRSRRPGETFPAHMARLRKMDGR